MGEKLSQLATLIDRMAPQLGTAERAEVVSGLKLAAQRSREETRPHLVAIAEQLETPFH